MGKACKETKSSGSCARLSPCTGKIYLLPQPCCSSRRSGTATRYRPSRRICVIYSKKKKFFIGLRELIVDNFRYLRKIRSKFRFGRAICIRMICFYQQKLSHHTCLYNPTCSEYTKRCINNFGAIVGILLGIWRILRCNPLSKGGIDPAPERPLRKKWLL